MKLDASLVIDMNVTIEYHCSDVMMLVWPWEESFSGCDLFPICSPAFANVMDGMTVRQDYFMLKMLHLLKRTEKNLHLLFLKQNPLIYTLFVSMLKYEDKSLVKDDLVHSLQ